jgi:hypothetical protein
LRLRSARNQEPIINGSFKFVCRITLVLIWLQVPRLDIRDASIDADYFAHNLNDRVV